MNEEELDKILKEYLKEVYSCLSINCFTNYGYAGFHFHADLSEKNIDFTDSPYFYKDSKKFIHWTSVQNLMSIINNREIRFYNLHNSSDSEEFSYAATHLPIEESQINHLKKYLYTFSFCEASEMNNSHLWNIYGNNYKGVALEFEIVNDPEMWEVFMMSKVYYEMPKQLIDLKDKLESLKSENPLMSSNFNFGKLIGFHKRTNYSEEKEIRISTLYPFGSEHEAYLKHCKPDFRFDKNRHRMTEYFGLNLWVNNESPYLQSYKDIYDRKIIIEEDYFVKKPKIKISKITFGKNCGVENQDFISYYTRLNEILMNQFGYEIEVSLNLFG